MWKESQCTEILINLLSNKGMRKGKLFRCNFSLYFVENLIKLKREDLDCVESVVPKDFEMELVFEEL